MDIDVAVIGAGAAGIGAARTLRDAGINYVLLEARDRVGGRAWTQQGFDLGCGWLHSADRNVLARSAESLNVPLDTSLPPWERPSHTANFPLDEQEAFGRAIDAFFERVAEFPQTHAGGDEAAAALLDPDSRWNPLIECVCTYITGGHLDRVSARDLAAYSDTGINWRVRHGYGTLIAHLAEGLNVKSGCAVRAIDHSGPRLVLETDHGTLYADRAIVTLPSNLIADGVIAFRPELPDIRDAAAQLPLGLAENFFLLLDAADEFETDTSMFGHTDAISTGNYHFRPSGAPAIKCVFCGDLAQDLAREGAAGFLAFAQQELSGVFGSDFARRISPAAFHSWTSDPWATGGYSYAVPGSAAARQILAQPVASRIFFAGEAASPHFFSTAHGAFETGRDAALQIAALRRD
jgi:monoamine oxidase